MGKNVWLVVSDLHLYDRNISSMVNYTGDLTKVREKLAQIALEYQDAGFDSVNLLLLGDVFHRSYKKINGAVYDTMFFVLWSRRFGRCYSVIGNHELSFYKENPFFELVNSIESKKIQGITNKVWQPHGLLPIFRVPDKVEDGEVVFHFNHYGTKVSKPDAGCVNIGLFHQDIVCRDIVDAMQNQLNGKVWVHTVDFSKLDVFDGYRYCFMGHMHKVYGTWAGDNGCTLYYLASLGRTNVGEVNDNFLERNVPAVLVSDGKFVDVRDHKFKLGSVRESIRQQVALENAHNYELQKLRNLSKEYDVLNDDPVKSLKQFFGDNEYVSTMLHGLIGSEIDEIGEELRMKFNRRFGQ